MKRILVPVDFSGDSLKALRFGIYLSNKLDCHLRMIHVQKSEKFEIPFHFEELKNEIIHTVQEYFEKLTELHSADYCVRNGVFDFKIRTGSVYREIVNQAKYGDAYMILMGAYGASGFEEFFIGSNAVKVVTNATCPVVTVQKEFTKGQLKTIVMPIDASTDTRKKIPFVSEIASRCNAKVHILGVHETSDTNVIGKIEHYMRQAEDYFKDGNIDYVKSIRKGDNNTFSSLDYAREVDADLIAIMTEQAESSINMFFGSYAQQMINRSEIPILSVPND
ncbi:universal stress protein [Labilibaculum sp. K2S]|uniref:universal stress protein n=1 Tax=Labilibaculum sp. K2S TaxID=3056386 RepID=UPI0025A38C23|nr:universal stress protein [Labilibaculum sp. K2S]MDM8161015.1 universal stress protein [Labilibaculum sp. K2S]